MTEKEPAAPLRIGDVAMDTITGFRGVVVARTEYLAGQTRVAIQSRELKDGKPMEPQWFDAPQVAAIPEPDRPGQFL